MEGGHKISVFGLENKNTELENYLRLAELVAKVICNASGQSAPFDSDSGQYIPSLALIATEDFDDNSLEEEVKFAILLFSRNKKFKNNLTAAKDFLVYKKKTIFIGLTGSQLALTTLHRETNIKDMFLKYSDL